MGMAFGTDVTQFMMCEQLEKEAQPYHLSSYKLVYAQNIKIHPVCQQTRLCSLLYYLLRLRLQKVIFPTLVKNIVILTRLSENRGVENHIVEDENVYR